MTHRIRKRQLSELPYINRWIFGLGVAGGEERRSPCSTATPASRLGAFASAAPSPLQCLPKVRARCGNVMATLAHRSSTCKLALPIGRQSLPEGALRAAVSCYVLRKVSLKRSRPERQAGK